MAFFRPPDIHHQGKAGKVFRSSAGRKLIDVWKWDIFTSVCSLFLWERVAISFLFEEKEHVSFLLPVCFKAADLSLYLLWKTRACSGCSFGPSLPAVAEPKGQTMQQGIQIVSGVVQGRFLLRQQPRRRIEHEATSVFGRRSCYLAISVQSVR